MEVVIALSRKDRFSPADEQKMRDFFATLSEKNRRRYAAIEATKLPHGGIMYVAAVLGCSRRTIRRGIAELDELTDGDPVAGRVRREGGGRPKRKSATPV